MQEVSFFQKYPVCKQLRQQQVERYFEFVAREELIKSSRENGFSCKKDGQDGEKRKPLKRNRRVRFSQELCLQSAVEQLDEKEVAEAVKKGVNFNFTIGNGTSLLHKAAMEGCGFMVELLIMGGADVNCQDGDWWTPLHVACYHDNFEVVQILLQANADPLKLDVDRNFPVDLSYESSDTRCLLAEYMIEQGITSEQMKLLKAQNKLVLEEVMKSSQFVNEDPNRHLHEGITLLHIASANGFMKLAKYLLENGARVNVIDASGMTPLHCATKFNQIKVAKLLVAHGADVSAKNFRGYQASDLTSLEEIHQLLSSSSQRGRTMLTDESSDDSDERYEEDSGPVTSRFVYSPHTSISKADRLSEARILQMFLFEKEESASLREYASLYGSVQAQDDDDDESASLYYSCIWKMDNAEVESLPIETATDDLAAMPVMDEKAVLVTLSNRYEAKLIYTYISDILIAMNPFSPLPLYGKSVSALYHKHENLHSQLTPHIYGVAERAFSAMLGAGVPQCCIIGGESGSGKTESFKYIVQHLLWNAGSLESDLIMKLAQMNPLMEAFGNAQTVLNSNSSRFAKYLTLTFSAGGKVLGGEISEFLLEKSRVVDQRPEENNFHIFYWMLAGVTPEEAGRCWLQDSNFRYLKAASKNMHGPQPIELKTKFWEVKDSLQFIGFTPEDVTCVVMILSAILHMGNIIFSSNDDDDDTSIITNMDVVKKVCSLLRISEEDFTTSVLEDTIHTRGEQVRKPLTPLQAREGVDGLAKALYSRLFSWIVHGLNQMVQAPLDSNSNQLIIGVLDLFGFENLSQNGFEQMCINLANEKLQSFYNVQVFDNERKDCIDEGISYIEIQSSQNQDVISLFLEKNSGIFDLLDEECMFPKATDVSLAAKLHSVAGKSRPSVYISPKYGGTSFTVAHYAGNINYSLSGILKTNKNILKPALSFVMRGSASLIVKELFHSHLARTGSINPSQRQRVSRHLKGVKSPLEFMRKLKLSKRDNQYYMANEDSAGQRKKETQAGETNLKKAKHTLTYHFKNSLSELVARIENSSCHFVRCIRPNKDRLPLKIDTDYVDSQLRYTGVTETVRIRKQGYPLRTTYSEFLSMYPTLAGLVQRDLDSVFTDHFETAENLLVKFGVSDFKVGKTKIFLRQREVSHLDSMEKDIYNKIVKVQSVVRRHLSSKLADERRIDKKMYCSYFIDFAADFESRQERMLTLQGYLNEADNEKIRLEKDRNETAFYINLLDSVLDNYIGQMDVSEKTQGSTSQRNDQNQVYHGKCTDHYQTPTRTQKSVDIDATLLKKKKKKKTRPAPLPPPQHLPSSPSSSPQAAWEASALSSGQSRVATPVDERKMDPSQNFPPSPREMYMYRPAQQVNGHSVQSPSPSRGRPPPVLPERRPETQLSNRSSRSSMSSKGSFSSEVASPPQSPGFAAHRQHPQHSSQQGSTRHSDNKPFSYAAAGSDVSDGNYKMDRDTSPHSRRGNIQYDGGAGFQRYAQHETDVSQQDNAAVYQRIDKSRDHMTSASDNKMAGGQEYYHSEDFQESSSSRKSEGIYGQFVEPSNGSHHRPSLTFVPPPVVPPLQPDFWKEDKTPAGHQQPVEVSHQKQQPHPQSHKVKAPTPQAPPPPPPPLRNSSTSQLSAQHHSNLSSVPVGSRSPRSGSPARAPLSMSHPGAKQPTLATMDELAQVKLRSVGDSSSPLQSPVAHTDTSGALNVRLRPTPGKFSNIYTEDEVTLPSPPDDLDELPPPPPPHELLNDDLSSMALQPPHGTPGEANSSQIDHRHPQLPLWQQQWCTPGCSSSQLEDSASSARGRSASSRSTRTAENSALDNQIPGSVSSMDFEIPDDIDLSQCPGLVEITKHTPNWKRDMIEKKNQEKIEEYVKKILKEREQEAKWKNVPEWKKKILQKKEEEEGAVATVNIASDVKSPAGKKPAKKAPVPPPKEAKEDFTPPKPKGDIVPAALSIDPEELAAMPPWKRELLFKRDKVPVTFSNEFNPEDENANEDQPS